MVPLQNGAKMVAWKQPEGLMKSGGAAPLIPNPLALRKLMPLPPAKPTVHRRLSQSGHTRDDQQPPQGCCLSVEVCWLLAKWELPRPMGLPLALPAPQAEERKSGPPEELTGRWQGASKGAKISMTTVH